jgi:ornithine decarboxylase
VRLVVVVLPEADVAARGLDPVSLVDAVWAHALPADGLEHATAEPVTDAIAIVGYLIATSDAAAARRFRELIARAMATPPDSPAPSPPAVSRKDTMLIDKMPTPYLLLDVSVATSDYGRLSRAFHDARIFYAVKANPEPRLIRALVRLGASFDVASPAEIDLCLGEGADPATLSYGNTIKKAVDIAFAFDRGVRMYAFDSIGELEKLSKNAAGSAVYCRVIASSDGARWPLSRKFGCTVPMAADLLIEADQLGLVPVGVSFHVGSQQLDPGRWDASIAAAAGVFRTVADRGIALTMLNAGGGFPVRYRDPVAPIEDFADAIHVSIDRHFPDGGPQLAIEPGRYIAAGAGVLRTSVVLIANKSPQDEARWVYLDVGRFGGLAETEGEAIAYRITTPHDALPGGSGPVMIAGPTCDSVDVLYERTPYSLPYALRPGDLVDIHMTGAYTTTYSAVGFNGFPPLATMCIGDQP